MTAATSRGSSENEKPPARRSSINGCSPQTNNLAFGSVCWRKSTITIDEVIMSSGGVGNPKRVSRMEHSRHVWVGLLDKKIVRLPA